MSHPYDKYVDALGGTVEGWVLWFGKPVDGEPPSDPVGAPKASITLPEWTLHEVGCGCGECPGVGHER